MPTPVQGLRSRFNPRLRVAHAQRETQQFRATPRIRPNQVFSRSCNRLAVVRMLGCMSETQFTRADWRPGKRRRSQPRVRNWGGRKQAPPAWLAAMAQSGFDSGLTPRCAHCGRFAFKGTNLCRFHNGPRVAKRPYVRSAIAAARDAVRQPQTTV